MAQWLKHCVVGTEVLCLNPQTQVSAVALLLRYIIYLFKGRMKRTVAVKSLASDHAFAHGINRGIYNDTHSLIL